MVYKYNSPNANWKPEVRRWAKKAAPHTNQPQPPTNFFNNSGIIRLVSRYLQDNNVA
jgi:hypothetical protein